ncbi:MAG TPA: rhomboid family intramembrane serine protease [Segeticoccus sp.]|uniref:rhomboid family intramembrane serine protease n=1 Tax=Segeticoccus sp. TaxID=2706531 RepID=UPI002D80AF3F|nr:rhomboid family intramembrane serine protease [Segeticoccus sp.]HET8600070.1 rhomboid family intramembrane serine protease [Segeticoccus sp.]
MSEHPAYQDQQAPVCPRHPDRVSYVRCQRCGRPTCPECQRPAAVGVQCVDCIREANRGARVTRTTLGGRASRDTRPLVTYTLIAICVLVWLGQLASPIVTRDLWFSPLQGSSEPWRFVTAAFVHAPGIGNIWHIGFNMYALWILGQYLEPLLGRVRFLALYLISAIGGSVGYLLFAQPPTIQNPQTGWVTPTVGASGAVFGLFLAMFVINRHLGRSSAGILGILVINAVLGFIVPGIAWQAHVGGAITGLLCGAVIAWTSPRAPTWRRQLQVPLLVAVLVLAGVLAWLRYATVTLPY